MQCVHDNPMVNESGIIVLLRQFWISVGKGKSTMRRVFLWASTCFRNSQRWECSEMSLRAQVSRWSNSEWVWDHHFSETGLVVCEKKRVLGGGEGKIKLRGGDVESIVWLT